MKKGIVALAVMSAFSGAALAQSSVTLYGILDIGYQWNEVPTNVGTTAAPRIQQESFSSITSGIQSGNRWGLRGAEDLGGGWKAIFALESGFDLDTGNSGQGGRLFGRQAYVGFSTGFGDLVAGRLASFSSGTGDFDMFGRVDPMGTAFGVAQIGSTFYSAAALRVDNAIAYRTPKFAGFQGGLGYTTSINGQEVAPSDRNIDAIFTGINWSYGPFFAVVTYDAIDNVGSAPDQKHLQIGGTFDLGPVRFHAGYADQSNLGAIPSVLGAVGPVFIVLPAGIPSFDNSAWMLGATWTVGAFKVFGSYQQSDADSQSVRVGNNLVNFEPDYNVWGIGATYNLSRRTNLYTAYGSRDADGTLAGNSFNAKQFSAGVRHLF